MRRARIRNTLIFLCVMTLYIIQLKGISSEESSELSGFVYEAETQKGIERAKISLRAGLVTYCATTDSTGKYSVAGLPSGITVPVTVSHPDYKDTVIRTPLKYGAVTGRNFELLSTFLSLLYPNGGESIFAGSEVNIAWYSVGIRTVRLEFSINSGRNWRLIEDGVDADAGGYLWDVPDIPSTDYLIRITDISDDSLSDVSDSVFSNDST